MEPLGPKFGDGPDTLASVLATGLRITIFRVALHYVTPVATVQLYQGKLTISSQKIANFKM
jgi:hypothetical protein